MIIHKKILLLIFLTSSFLSFGQLNVIANRPEATYQIGEQMYFEVTSPSSSEINYSIIYDDKTPVISNGTVKVTSSGTARIPFTLNTAGFVICNVSQDDNFSKAGAGFSPYNIMPFEDEPSDFDQFWNGMKAQLATIPMDAQVYFLSETQYSKTYKMSLANIEGRRVYGYITIPKGDAPYPAVLTVPPYGNGADHVRPEPFLAEVGGFISVTISIHNADPAVGDPNAYMPNDVSTKEGNYYRFGLMGAVRAIDYIYTMPEFDGQNLAVTGISQGGGLSISVAGLDSRVDVLACGIPALCQNSALKYGRASDNPYFVFTSRVTVGTAVHEAATVHATKYYDAMNFAKRFHGPSLMSMSLEDTVCPTDAVFAANNQLIGKKIIVQERELGHDIHYFWAGRFNFFKNYFNMIPPITSIDTKEGHFIDVGGDLTTSINASVALSGVTKFENVVNVDFPVKWSKVSGPGKISFSNNSNRTTTATFSKKGDYLIKMEAIDDALLLDDVDQRRVIMIDYLKVHVN